MSHSYVVADPSRAVVMPVEEFVARARERWPGAEDEGGGRISLRPVPGLGARSMFFTGYSLAVVNGDLEQFVEIARWYRSLVPDDRELVLGDESSGELHAGFTLDTSPDEVRATFATGGRGDVVETDQVPQNVR